MARFRPLIQPAQRKPPLLSFWNLVEAHILRALRSDHGVSLGDVREAIGYAEQHLNIDNLLLDKQLRTEAGQLFLDRYGELVNVSRSGQIAMRKVFEDHLRSIEWGDLPYPVRLYPFLSGSRDSSDKPIVIDPEIAFGRPIIARIGISTHAISDRIDAGESIDDLAEDYDLSADEIEQAVLYERAARRSVQAQFTRLVQHSRPPPSPA
jgi:uncharacterized protein (DUF433 family)